MKNQVDTFFNHLNSVDPHIKFTMESPFTDDPYLDTMCLPNKDHSIQTSVYRKPTHTNQYLDWNSNHPKSAKNQWFMPWSTELKLSVPLRFQSEMDFLSYIFLKNK